MSGMDPNSLLDWIWMGSLCLWLLSIFALIVGIASLIGFWRARRRRRARLASLQPGRGLASATSVGWRDGAHTTYRSHAP